MLAPDAPREYHDKLTSAEEAVALVRDGDTVGIGVGTEPAALAAALAARRDLSGVTVVAMGPQTDFGWLAEGSPFRLRLDMATGFAQRAVNEGRADYAPLLMSRRFKAADEGRAGSERLDVALVVVSPPDRHGYCSFGHTLFNKRSYARRARTVLAEVDSGQVRTFGTNRIHVSEVTRFVERSEPLASFVMLPASPSAEAATIRDFVRPLIPDGAVLQIGPGSNVAGLIPIGLLDGKDDLGVHTAVIGTEMLAAIRAGDFRGRHKTLHPGVIVTSGFAGMPRVDLDFVDENPLFEVYDAEYVNDVCTIAAHDRMLTLNGAIGVDLTGQIAADGWGAQMWSGAAGQIEFAVGAALSRGGRAISVLKATAEGGRTSRIVPVLPAATPVSIMRTFADTIVTEFGVAELVGKSLRERSEALIAIAHPDFHGELRAEAKRLYGG
jgi:acyl-CoA hydrolase